MDTISLITNMKGLMLRVGEDSFYACLDGESITINYSDTNGGIDSAIQKSVIYIFKKRSRK